MFRIILVCVVFAMNYCYKYQSYKVRVETDPTEAVIEFNGNKVGRSPCEFTAIVPSEWKGCLYGGYQPVYGFNRIIAYPTESGLYTQTKILTNREMMQPNLNLYFDLHLSWIGKKGGKAKDGKRDKQSKLSKQSKQRIQDKQNLQTSFIMREEHLEKLKALAYWDRKQIKELMDEVVGFYLKDKKIRSLKKMSVYWG